MSKETTENFWRAWTEFVSEPVPSVFYRLYYNNDGSPICYTMEDLPGNYIEVDRETYVVGSYHVRVIDQKLVSIPTTDHVKKLKPLHATGIACDPQDVCVVVSEHMPHRKWSMQ